MVAALRLSLVVLLGLAVASCATVADTYVVSNKLLGAPPDQMGTVVGSIGISKKGRSHQRYTLVASEIASKEKVQFYFKRSGLFDTPTDFDDARAEVSIFVLELPQGRYQIQNFEYHSVGLWGSEFRQNAREEFSVSFEIVAGQTTYLGEFVAMPIFGRNLFGREVPAATYWEISDKEARDIALARQRMPGPNLGRVTAAVPDPGKIKLPFFTRPGEMPRAQSAAAEQAKP
jgi:hypothetical protein